jgi:hypothetical protein
MRAFLPATKIVPHPEPAPCKGVVSKDALCQCHDSRAYEVGATLTSSIFCKQTWHICFVFRDGDAYEVEIVDYHKG